MAAHNSFTVRIVIRLFLLRNACMFMYAVFWRMSILISRLYQNGEGITIYEIWDFRASSDHGRIHICTISAYFGRLLYKKVCLGECALVDCVHLVIFRHFCKGGKVCDFPFAFAYTPSPVWKGIYSESRRERQNSFDNTPLNKTASHAPCPATAIYSLCTSVV